MSIYAYYAHHVYDHVFVAECILARKLGPKEVVHHKDGNYKNNAPGNLVVYATQAEHMQEHRAEECRSLGIPEDSRLCVFCHKWDSPLNLIMHGKNDISRKHRACWNAYMRNYKQRSLNA